MISLLKLIRPVNLIMLALTQYFIDVFVLQPLFNKYGLIFTLTEFQFFLLVLSTGLICAAGYIINDYFDVKADAINKPDEVIIGKSISPQNAFNWYLVLTGIGLALGIYLSIVAGNWKLVTVHIICIFLLFAYSSSFKKVALLGNIIVALLIAISILMIGVFEPHLYNLAREGDYYIANLCWNIIFGLSLFAFLLTMVREIVKVMEDVRGDKEINARTIPIIWGMQTAKGMAAFFILATIGSAIYFFNKLETSSQNIYLVLLIVLIGLLLFTLFKLVSANQKKQFAQLSFLLKICMLVGICFLPLYYLLEF